MPAGSETVRSKLMRARRPSNSSAESMLWNQGPRVIRHRIRGLRTPAIRPRPPPTSSPAAQAGALQRAPRLLAARPDRPALRARRLAPDPPVCWLTLDAPGCRRTLSLVWRADAYQSAAARALAEFAVGYFRTWRGDA